MKTLKITRFRGIDRYTSAVNQKPDRAQDLLNVICNPSGELSKLRVPVALTAAIAGIADGPTSLYNFQTPSGYNVLLAQFGEDLYSFTVGSWVATLLNTDVLNDDVWDWVTSNNIAFGMNSRRALKVLPGGVVYEWGIDKPAVAPTLGAAVGPGITVATGRKYRVSYKCSVTGHCGTASDESASTGPLANQCKPITFSATTDPQVDTIVLWATLDGGSDYYYHSERAYALGTTIASDTLPDTGLNKAIRAPLLNDVPPVGKYLQKSQNRIFVFNLDGAKHDIGYSGYEQILYGRPEESFPPSNRLRLAIGADEIRGGGVLQAGVVAWSKSNEMYMLRGEVEDVSTTAPVAFSAFLEQLPWNLGSCSHYSGAATPHGFFWLASDKTIRVFDGTGEPVIVSRGIAPLLRRITPGQEENCRGYYYSWLDHEWYILLIPIDGSTELNRIIFVDLDPRPETNAGIFVSDVQADALTVFEDLDGQRVLSLGRDGQVFQLPTSSDRDSGVASTITTSDEEMQAYWRSGYIGNDDPEYFKMWREARLVTDNDGFGIAAFLVDDERYIFRAPRNIEYADVGPSTSINEKSRRLALEVRFPREDVSCNVLSLGIIYDRTGMR